MSRTLGAAVVMFITCGGMAAADDRDAVGAPETKIVEVFFAAEHVPAGLAAGSKVDLKGVIGATFFPMGRVEYRSLTIVPGLEFVSAGEVEKPLFPRFPMRIELKATADQAEKIEKAKERRATVVRAKPGGGRETAEEPLTLRLELSKPADMK